MYERYQSYRNAEGYACGNLTCRNSQHINGRGRLCLLPVSLKAIPLYGARFPFTCPAKKPQIKDTKKSDLAFDWCGHFLCGLCKLWIGAMIPIIRSNALTLLPQSLIQKACQCITAVQAIFPVHDSQQSFFFYILCLCF